MKNAKHSHPSLTALRWIRRLGVAIIVLPLMSFSATFGYRLAMWRSDARAASSVAVDMGATDADRVRALVVLHSHAAECRRVIARIAAEPGPVGAHARMLLASRTR